MKIEHDFTIGKPIDVVWPVFEDVPALAQCLPGATITEDLGDGNFRGHIAVKLGPFSAQFEGDAKNTLQPERHAGHLDGKGIDKRGGSRTKMALDFQLEALADQTRVAVQADLTLSGPVAQFGRVGVIQQTAEMFIGQFADNLEQKLNAAEAGPDAQADGTPPADEVPSPASARSDPSSPSAAVGSSVNLLTVMKALVGRYLRRLTGGGKSP